MPELELDVFWGKTSQNVANVFVRAAGQPADATLRGSVYGPTCRYSRTLPGRAPLVDLGPGENLLAQAVLPDPCFWSPALPFLYRVEVELIRNDQVVAAAARSLGIRMFGARGRDLRLEGKRWVARGVRYESVTPSSLPALHDAPLVICCAEPDDTLCQQASEAGVMILAVVGERESIFATARRLARWPAVAMIFLPASAAIDQARLAALPNTVLGAVSSPRELVKPPQWAAALLVEIDRPEDVAGLAACPVAVIAAASESLVGRLGRGNLDQGDPESGTENTGCSGGAKSEEDASDYQGGDVEGTQTFAERKATDDLSENYQAAAAARAACDRLQSQLAPIGDFAGYLVNFNTGRIS